MKSMTLKNRVTIVQLHIKNVLLRYSLCFYLLIHYTLRGHLYCFSMFVQWYNILGTRNDKYVCTYNYEMNMTEYLSTKTLN